jgi:pilus assembly protein CpaF
LIVQQARFPDGSRRVTRITEVCGLTDEGEPLLSDIFVFAQQGRDDRGDVRGLFRPTGHVPSFVERFLTEGMADAETCL